MPEAPTSQRSPPMADQSESTDTVAPLASDNLIPLTPLVEKLRTNKQQAVSRRKRMQTEMSKVVVELERLAGDNAKLQRRFSHLEREKGSLATRAARASELEVEVGQLKDAIAKEQSTRAELESGLAAARAELADAKELHAAEMSELTIVINDLNQTAAAAHRDLETLTSVSPFMSELDATSDAGSEPREVKDADADTIAVLTSDLAVSQARLAEVEGDLAAARRELGHMTARDVSRTVLDGVMKRVIGDWGGRVDWVEVTPTPPGGVALPVVSLIDATTATPDPAPARIVELEDIVHTGGIAREELDQMLTSTRTELMDTGEALRAAVAATSRVEAAKDAELDALRTDLASTRAALDEARALSSAPRHVLRASDQEIEAAAQLEDVKEALRLSRMQAEESGQTVAALSVKLAETRARTMALASAVDDARREATYQARRAAVLEEVVLDRDDALEASLRAGQNLVVSVDVLPIDSDVPTDVPTTPTPSPTTESPPWVGWPGMGSPEPDLLPDGGGGGRRDIDSSNDDDDDDVEDEDEDPTLTDSSTPGLYRDETALTMTIYSGQSLPDVPDGWCDDPTDDPRPTPEPTRVSRWEHGEESDESNPTPTPTRPHTRSHSRSHSRTLRRPDPDLDTALDTMRALTADGASCIKFPRYPNGRAERRFIRYSGHEFSWARDREAPPTSVGIADIIKCIPGAVGPAFWHGTAQSPFVETPYLSMVLVLRNGVTIDICCLTRQCFISFFTVIRNDVIAHHPIDMKEHWAQMRWGRLLWWFTLGHLTAIASKDHASLQQYLVRRAKLWPLTRSGTGIWGCSDTDGDSDDSEIIGLNQASHRIASAILSLSSGKL